MKITATLLKYGEDSIPDGWGDVVTFAQDSLYTDPRQNVPLLLEHQGQTWAVGYSTRVWTEGDTVMGEFDLLDTPAGLAAQAELAAGLRLDVSIGVWMDEYAAEQLDPEDDSWLAPQRLTVSLADLVETSLCLRGRMPSAQVDTVSTDEGINA